MMEGMINDYLQESATLQATLLKDEVLPLFVAKAVELTLGAFRVGQKVLVAGNGGSAAEAQHFAAEFVCRYKRERKGYPAIALTTDPSAITAWGNDYEFDGIFERQIEALGAAGDVLYLFTTSGNSKNLIRAAAKAKSMSITTIAFIGRDGGALKGLADIEYIVPSENTPRIQEVHLFLLHSIAEDVEKNL